MKKVFFLIVCLIFSTSVFANGIIVLYGYYQGKNIFIQNSFGANSGVGFCVEEVRVNGNVTTDNISSIAFEIDLRNFKLKLGDKVEIKIIYKDNCQPKVLNPEVLYPKSTYEIVDMSVDENFVFKWSTKGESGKLRYVVEQYRWNRWIKIGEIEGNGYPEENEYAFKVAPHSGKNKLRVKQTDYTKQPRVSRVIEVKSSVAEVVFRPVKVTNEILFYNNIDTPTETTYEIYDQFGTIMKRGYASKINVTDLREGAYYLYFDNVMDQFLKK